MPWKISHILVVPIFLLMTCPVLACPLDLPTSTITVAGHELEVELACTTTARMCGLSNRQAMPENHGMLFIHKKPTSLGIWMKNTHFPLSVAFIDTTGKIINIHHNMPPDQTEEHYYADVPAKYALEVNQGWFKARGIKAGDMVEIQLPVILKIQ